MSPSSGFEPPRRVSHGRAGLRLGHETIRVVCHDDVTQAPPRGSHFVHVSLEHPKRDIHRLRRRRAASELRVHGGDELGTLVLPHRLGRANVFHGVRVLHLRQVVHVPVRPPLRVSVDERGVSNRQRRRQFFDPRRDWDKARAVRGVRPVPSDPTDGVWKPPACLKDVRVRGSM